MFGLVPGAFMAQSKRVEYLVAFQRDGLFKRKIAAHAGVLVHAGETNV